MKTIILCIVLATVASGTVLRHAPAIRQPERVVEETRSLQTEQRKANDDLEEEQNKSAFYHFESAIDDKISDQSQTRDETREGLKVKGSYSYSDGYHKRTVMYEADENGYRVVGENIEPLDGPTVNVDGTASVHAAAHGNDLSYTIKSIPIEEGKTRIFDIAQR